MMDRIWGIVRNLILLGCALVLFVTAAAVTQSSGFGACVHALKDIALSVLDEADGDPANPRLNASGALWTVDSDLADAIFNTQRDVEGDGEGGGYFIFLPPGTRHFHALLAFQGGYKASATGYVLCGFSAGSAGIFLCKDTPSVDIPDLDLGNLGGTFFMDSGGGIVRIKAWWTVSQNPD